MTGRAVNPIVISDGLVAAFRASAASITSEPVDAHGSPRLISGVLTQVEVNELLSEFDRQRWQPVGIDGIAAHFGDRDRVGSWRATVDSPAFAEVLWARLGALLGGRFSFGCRNTIDHHGHDRWEAVGLNSRLRFIRYRGGGLLIPHYDAPYDYGDGDLRTLRTVVIYLECSAQGGATRFISDPQADLPYPERDFSDWTRAADLGEVVCAVNGAPGQALVFDHRVLHDSEPLAGRGQKTIIRTDIVFRRLRG